MVVGFVVFDFASGSCVCGCVCGYVLCLCFVGCVLCIVCLWVCCVVACCVLRPGSAHCDLALAVEVW